MKIRMKNSDIDINMGFVVQTSSACMALKRFKIRFHEHFTRFKSIVERGKKLLRVLREESSQHLNFQFKSHFIFDCTKSIIQSVKFEDVCHCRFISKSDACSKHTIDTWDGTDDVIECLKRFSLGDR